MSRKILLNITLALILYTLPAIGEGFVFVELNCENLFDCAHDSLKNDYEYCEGGLRRWNNNRYWRKLNNIARAIVSCGSDGGNGDWHQPDLAVLVEVENDSVMERLTKRSLLNRLHYDYVMTNSPDQRGIDVALLYNPLSMKLINHYGIRVSPPSDHSPTRDILYTSLLTGTTPLHVFGVHFPSRSGGEKETEPYRLAVSERLCQSIDSILAIDTTAYIIVAGDFNDYSDNLSIKKLHNHGMKEVLPANNDIATYRYKGDWGSLDHVLVSLGFVDKYVNISCRINDADFLLEPETTYGGKRPQRTYNGIRYNPNGVSDHLPLILSF